MRPTGSSRGIPLITDSRVLLYLFIGLRLMMLLVHSPVQGYTPGLTAFGDLPYFYDLAKNVDQGKVPYRDYWFEYPPVLALTNTNVYLLGSMRGGEFPAYALLMVALMTACDTSSLILVRQIGKQIHGEEIGIALSWIYALLAVPLIFSYWNFDSIIAFFLLLALHWLLQGRDVRSAVILGIGALTKFFPLALVAAIWRFKSPGRALRYSILAVGITALGLLAMVAYGPYGMSSLVVQFNKPSSQTVWALIDGNYRTGILNPNHFDVTAPYHTQGNPARIPSWLRGVVFGAIGLSIFIITRRRDDFAVVAFITVTLLLLILWSANWSPQWQVFLIPLILLNFPSRTGVLIAFVLGLMGFIEFPILFARSSGEVPTANLPLFTLLILFRTGILIGIVAALTKRLRIPVGNTTNTSMTTETAVL